MILPVVAAAAGIALLIFLLRFAVKGVSSHAGPRLTEEVKNPELPLPSDARVLLETFCSYMQRLDNAMPYCTYTGNATLRGDFSPSGNGSVSFWYDKDFSTVGKAVEEMGYTFTEHKNGDSLEGWSLGSSGEIVYLNHYHVTGYKLWTGFPESRMPTSEEIADITSSWETDIRSVIRGNWPNAQILTCSISSPLTEHSAMSFNVALQTNP